MGASRLADVLHDAVQNVGHCESCRTLTEEPLCRICASDHRDAGLLCVVESPADIEVIEASGAFNGKYFVLMGHLSPIDGIGPGELGLDLLEARLDKEPVQELIVATNPTVEGEATAHYIQQLADKYQGGGIASGSRHSCWRRIGIS